MTCYRGASNAIRGVFSLNFKLYNQLASSLQFFFLHEVAGELPVISKAWSARRAKFKYMNCTLEGKKKKNQQHTSSTASCLALAIMQTPASLIFMKSLKCGLFLIENPSLKF